MHNRWWCQTRWSFVRAAPHELVEAFQATLSGSGTKSDLLLHVVDGASDQREQQIEAVNAVLRRLALPIFRN